jgi:hypothetical protein
MDRDTFTATIRTFKQRSPFHPFTIVTVAGNRHEVDFPDGILARDGVAVFLGPGGIPTIFDAEGVSEIVGDLTGTAAQT